MLSPMRFGKLLPRTEVHLMCSAKRETEERIFHYCFEFRQLAFNCEGGTVRGSGVPGWTHSGAVVVHTPRIEHGALGLDLPRVAPPRSDFALVCHWDDVFF